MTDQFSSLSIGAITFDLSDSAIVYAGMGSFSSSGLAGGSGQLQKATEPGTANGCCTTYGKVYVSHPQVFTRERLVAAREKELQFLNSSLNAH
jgi:hypothetical protein